VLQVSVSFEIAFLMPKPVKMIPIASIKPRNIAFLLIL